MKIQAKHLSHMRSAIEPLDTNALRSCYADADLSDMRYRWDLARKAGLITWFCDELYSYLNDTHIDTALRSIVKPL